MGQAQGDAGVLLHQHHGEAFLVEGAQGGEDVAHDDGSQAHGRLVEQQEHARLGHERPPDGQHLLLAAGQGAGLLPLPLFQPGEEGEDLLQPLRHRRPLRACASTSRAPGSRPP